MKEDEEDEGNEKVEADKRIKNALKRASRLHVSTLQPGSDQLKILLKS